MTRIRICFHHSMKPDSKSNRARSSDGRRLEQQSRMHLRRSHSAGCNKGKNLQEVTTKRDDDGTNEPFVLEATSLAPARIRSNDNIAQGRRQISSSFARLGIPREQKQWSAVNNTALMPPQNDKKTAYILGVE